MMRCGSGAAPPEEGPRCREVWELITGSESWSWAFVQQNVDTSSGSCRDGQGLVTAPGGPMKGSSQGFKCKDKGGCFEHWYQCLAAECMGAGMEAN